MVTIKKAAECDIPTIRNLAERSWWPTYSAILSERQIRFMLDTLYSEKRLTEGFRTNEVFLLMHDKNGYTGFVSYQPWKEEAAWKINKLYVLPECHGLGYGRKLVEEVIRAARDEGITTLVLNVNKFNPAFNFYKKLGFTVLREEDIPIGQYWMNDYVMILPLK